MRGPLSVGNLGRRDALSGLVSDSTSEHRCIVMQDGSIDEVGKDASEAVASVTIARSREDLHALWRDPATLPRIMDHFATIQTLGQNEAEWTVEAPLGKTYRWRTSIVHDDPAVIRWATLDGADIRNRTSEPRDRTFTPCSFRSPRRSSGQGSRQAVSPRAARNRPDGIVQIPRACRQRRDTNLRPTACRP